MNESNYKDLVEASWRRRLTPDEEARLQAFFAIHPEKQAEWEEEAALTESLRELKEVPLASNFTAQILLALDRETARTAATPVSPWQRLSTTLRRYIPRFAAAVLVVGFSTFGLIQYRAYNQKQVARTMVATIGEIASVLPSPEVLQDFDSINQLRDASRATDQDLLAILEK
jgi:anti-sigma factor RsiW